MEMLTRVTLALCCALAICLPALSAGAADDAPPLELRRIVPSGEDVPSTRQIVLEFNRAVAPIGRMARTVDEIPFTVEPPLACECRWLNTSALACQLGDGEGTSSAARYALKLKPGVTALEGQTVELDQGHNFVVQRPDIRWPNFVTWLSPGLPVIRIVFNQAVTANSVAQHVFVRPEGDITTRIGVTVLEDTTDARDFRLVTVANGKTVVVGSPKSVPGRVKAKSTPSRTWLITPNHQLALDTRFDLRTEPGLRSGEGPEPGIKDRLIVQFDSFPEFQFLGIQYSGRA
jgi:hypothetical protein